jgi:hypothetical protein
LATRELKLASAKGAAIISSLGQRPRNLSEAKSQR